MSSVKVPIDKASVFKKLPHNSQDSPNVTLDDKNSSKKHRLTRPSTEKNARSSSKMTIRQIANTSISKITEGSTGKALGYDDNTRTGTHSMNSTTTNYHMAKRDTSFKKRDSSLRVNQHSADSQKRKNNSLASNRKNNFASVLLSGCNSTPANLNNNHTGNISNAEIDIIGIGLPLIQEDQKLSIDTSEHKQANQIINTKFGHDYLTFDDYDHPRKDKPFPHVNFKDKNLLNGKNKQSGQIRD